MTSSISVEGLNEVLRKLNNADKEVRKAASAGMQRAGLDIIADAQMNLRANMSVVTGLLRQSGKVQKIDDDTLDVGFFDTQNRQTGYAFYVEYGRRAGKLPPPDELAQWAYKKFRIKDRKAAEAMGWALAKKIAKEGTHPHPFFVPAVEKNKKQIIETLQNAINNSVR